MDPAETTFILTGLRRVFNSAKVHAALGVLLPTFFIVHYAAATLPPTQRMGLWIAFISAAVVLGREVINAWAQEDAAAKSQPAQTAAPLQINTGSPAQNFNEPAPAPAPAPAPKEMPATDDHR
jgi:hypothetical protein